MATKAKTTLLFLALLLFASTLALTSRREEEKQQRRQEFEQCKQDCRQQGQQQRWHCEQQCEKKYEEEREEQGHDSRHEDAKRRLEQCQQQCREGRQGQQQQWECERQCQQQYEQERHVQSRESYQDPECQLEQCKQDCRQQGQQQERYLCEQQCQQQYEEERRRESGHQDPKRQLEQCKQDCQQRQPGQSMQQLCEQVCERQYKEQQRQQEGKGSDSPQREEEEERTGKNPYVFEQESFKQRIRSEHGNIRVLQNFAQKSKLLIGIANYRLAILEANPNTFVVPNHFDADSVFYVVRGEGSITLIKQDQDRESYNIKQGDIIKVSSGTVMYLINRSNNQRLQIAKLLQPVFNPGQFEEFYTVGGDQPESYYRVFSIEILEAALNTRQDQLKKLFGQQRQGIIVKASEEQIKALSHHSSSSSGDESKGPFNLLNKRPTQSNDHGRLHEANSNDYKPLRDLNIQVSFANITSGSMVAPFYNSRATKIAMVTSGRGYFEMVCPHLSSQQESKEQKEEEQQGQKQYQKVQSQVFEKTVFIVPPGHPIAIVASKEQNLEVVCFEINVEGNRRMLVAGGDNVVSKMEQEAKELAFGVESKFVDQVFGGKQEKFFVKGPAQKESKEEGRHRALESILNFARF